MAIIIYCSDTSRPLFEQEEFSAYLQMDRAGMEKEIEAGGFLEYGAYGEHLYGTKLDSVREIIRSSKMCVLDIEPTVRVALPSAGMRTTLGAVHRSGSEVNLQ